MAVSRDETKFIHFVMSVLEDILARKRKELPALRHTKLPEAPELRPFQLGAPGRLGLIAEIKRKSPSAGWLSQTLSVEQRAAAYEAGGADAVSVLCDEHFFAGSYECLALARSACSLPLLCKEFIIDPVQLDLARAWGADAALLIVRCLTDAQLQDLVAACTERKLAALVEIHTAVELKRALAAGAELIGVNARDLDTLEMNATRAAAVLAEIPSNVRSVHLSGLSQPSDVARIRRGPADAALIGEALMRQDDPLPLLSELSAAASA
ncbi:MAG: indole-3-glycerol-phosphate synthase [Polyangiaceae bacterium]|nr:indole-3-glycerol-phosphate synthase [Polyangiaceae bacterium]